MFMDVNYTLWMKYPRHGWKSGRLFFGVPSTWMSDRFQLWYYPSTLLSSLLRVLCIELLQSLQCVTSRNLRNLVWGT